MRDEQKRYLLLALQRTSVRVVVEQEVRGRENQHDLLGEKRSLSHELNTSSCRLAPCFCRFDGWKMFSVVCPQFSTFRIWRRCSTLKMFSVFLVFSLLRKCGEGKRGRVSFFFSLKISHLGFFIWKTFSNLILSFDKNKWFLDISEVLYGS